MRSARTFGATSGIRPMRPSGSSDEPEHEVEQEDRPMKKWVFPAIAVGVAAQGFRLRQRIAALHVLPPSAAELDSSHRLITRAGVRVNQATARAASAYA